MKKILVAILSFFLSLLLPAIFGGTGAGVYFGVIKPQSDARKILANGTETTAAVKEVKSKISVSSSSGSRRTSGRLYYLVLSFVNSDGDKIEYRTRSIYPEDFIRNHQITEESSVQVKYIGSKAVVTGLVPEYEIWLWLFPVVFGAIGAGFIFLMALSLVWNANDSFIKKYGIPATGTYLEQKKYVDNKESNFNNIIFTFRNENGEIIEVKSNPVYSNSDAQKLAEMGSFPIKYRGKKAVIIIDKN